MHQYHSRAESAMDTRSRRGATTAPQQGMIRGVVFGVILSLAVWGAGGYIAFILH